MLQNKISVLEPSITNNSSESLKKITSKIHINNEFTLRISVTDNCNFNCFFCHNEGQDKKISNTEILESKDIVKLVKAAHQCGVKKIKLTGGEPLLRNDIINLISQISEVGKDDPDFDLALVTNGLILEKYALGLKKAGLKRLNISLSTLNESIMKKYFINTGSSQYIKQIINGISIAKEVGIKPIKINCVLFYSPLKHEGNIEEIPDIIKLCKDLSVDELKFYVLLWHKNFDDFNKHYIYWDDDLVLDKIKSALTMQNLDVDSVNDVIEKLKAFSDDSFDNLNKARKTFEINDLKISFDSVKPGKYHNKKACVNCNYKDKCQEGPLSLRISHNGKIKGCLINDINMDLKTILNSENHQETLNIEFKKIINDIKENYL